jgi:hypothetical protein
VSAFRIAEITNRFSFEQSPHTAMFNKHAASAIEKNLFAPLVSANAPFHVISFANPADRWIITLVKTSVDQNVQR